MINTSTNYNETKQNIFDTAKSLFYEKGYYNTSIGNISEIANVNRSLVSYYFESKGNLALQIVNQFNTTISEKINLNLLEKNQALNPLVLFAVETRTFNSFRRFNENYRRFMKEICIENILTLSKSWIVKTEGSNHMYDYLEKTYGINLDIIEKQIYMSSFSSILSGLIIIHSEGHIDCSHDYIAEKECEMFFKMVGLNESEISLILQESKSICDGIDIKMEKNFNIKILS